MRQIPKQSNILTLSFLFFLAFIGGSCDRDDDKGECSDSQLDELLNEANCPFAFVCRKDKDIIGEWKLMGYREFINGERIFTDYSCNTEVIYRFDVDFRLTIASDLEDEKAGVFNYNYNYHKYSALRGIPAPNLSYDGKRWFCNLYESTMVMRNSDNFVDKVFIRIK